MAKARTIEALGEFEHVTGGFVDFHEVEAEVFVEAVSGFDGEVDVLALLEVLVDDAGDFRVVATFNHGVDEGLDGCSGASFGEVKSAIAR